jgi:phosphatidylserine synthase
MKQALLVILGLLMVTTFRFWSLKALDFRQRRSYRAAVPLIGVIVLLAFWPERFVPGITVAYAASGPIGWLLGRLRGHK